MIRHLVIILCILTSVWLLPTALSPVQASSVISITLNLGCTSFFIDVDYQTDHDNTGNNIESMIIEITDGAGKKLYDDGPAALVAGSAYTFGFSNTYPYNDGLPDYNPIRFRWFSPAGNNFEEQTAYTTEGECSGLPYYSSGESPTPGFSGPALPAKRNLMRIVRDTAVYSEPGGAPTGSILKTCQTVFVIDTSEDGKYHEVFFMGGWIPASTAVDVPESYGQLGVGVSSDCIGH
jgi:hypothetical protein